MICLLGSPWKIISGPHIQNNLLQRTASKRHLSCFSRTSCESLVRYQYSFDCWIVFLIKRHWKTKSNKTCTKCLQKKKHLPWLEFFVFLTEKRNVFLPRYIWNGKIVSKQQLAALEKHSLKIILNNSNLLLPATSVLNHCWIFSPIRTYGQNSVLNQCRKRKRFPFAWSVVQIQKIPKH